MVGFSLWKKLVECGEGHCSGTVPLRRLNDSFGGDSPFPIGKKGTVLFLG